MNAGGAERVASTLANAWVSRSDHVTLMPTFSGGGECFYKLSPDVRLVYLANLVSSQKRSLVNQLARLRALRRFMSTNRPDIIVSFLSNVNVAVVVASAGLDIPVIVCERIDPFAIPMSRMLRLACRFTYPFANAVMVQTDAVAKKYRAAGWPLRHIPVIPNPLPEQMLGIERATSSDGEKRLLSVGRLDEQKQFDLLIRVFSKLAPSNPMWSLRILGEGTLRCKLQKQIDELGLNERIELPGRSADVGQELATADVFVLSSAYEGFPNALLEAMAVGVPSVTFDCPSGPRDITRNGQDAFLVPLGDEVLLERRLMQLMQDDALRMQMGMQAKQSVIGRYSLPAVLDMWDSLFNEVGVCR